MTTLRPHRLQHQVPRPDWADHLAPTYEEKNIVDNESNDDHSYPYLKLDWIGTSTGHRTYYLRYKYDEGGKWTSMQGQTSYYDHGITRMKSKLEIVKSINNLILMCSCQTRSI